MTKNISNNHLIIGPRGLDCGLMNINLGPMYFEIGGPLSGQQESGSCNLGGTDSWKSFMKRSTVCVNFSSGERLPSMQPMK